MDKEFIVINPQESYKNFGGLKVFRENSRDRDMKDFKQPDEYFISILGELGYTLMEHSLKDVIIRKVVDNSQACVIYTNSRVSFTCEDVELLKLVYIFLIRYKPIGCNYQDFCTVDYKDCYMSKIEFIQELKNMDFEVSEKGSGFDILANIDCIDVKPKIGSSYFSTRFNMSVYNDHLLSCLLRYSLTPLEYR